MSNSKIVSKQDDERFLFFLTTQFCNTDFKAKEKYIGYNASTISYMQIQEIWYLGLCLLDR